MMSIQYRSSFIWLIFSILIFTNNIYALPEIYKANTAWINVYRTAEPADSQDNVIAKLPRSTLFVASDEPVQYGKRFVVAANPSLSGYVNTDDITIESMEPGFKYFLMMTDVAIGVSGLDNEGIITTSKVSFIDKYNVRIYLTKIWDSLVPSKKNMIEYGVLMTWLIANNFDTSEKYCVELVLPNGKSAKEICATPETIKKMQHEDKRNNTEFSLGKDDIK